MSMVDEDEAESLYSEIGAGRNSRNHASKTQDSKIIDIF